MTIAIISGITVQVTSSHRPPWMFAPTSFTERRRYFTAKNTIRPAIRIEKNTEMPRRKKYRLSTRDAIVEAWGGNRGVPDHIASGRFLLAARGPRCRAWDGEPRERAASAARGEP